MGARVLGGISRPERAAAVRAAGADAIIDLSRADLRDSLREQVYAETDGRGADIIIDPLGGDVFDAAIRALAWCGRLVVIGFAAGGIPTLQDQLSAVEEHRGQRAADHRLPLSPPGRTRRPAMPSCLVSMSAVSSSRRRRTLFPLDRAGEALAAVRDRRIDGRAVLRLRDE